MIGEDGDDHIKAEQVAEWSGTISWEVLTSIGAAGGEALLGIRKRLRAIPDGARQVYVNWHF